MKFKLSKSQWEKIGRTAGWIKKATKMLDEDQIANWIDTEGGTEVPTENPMEKIYMSADKTYRLEIRWWKVYKNKVEEGSDYSFQCHPDGRTKGVLNADVVRELQSGKYADPVVYKVGNEYRLCDCGSGLTPHEDHDKRGISIGYVCDKCKASKRSKYRPEIFTDPNYYADEPIEPE